MSSWSFFLIFFFFLTKSIKCQWNYDDGLKDACRQMGGTFKQRESLDSITGDTCDLTFKVATHDDKDAREFCELYAPWRLITVERKHDNRETTTCHVEATYTCKSGWIQMFGHCFRMPQKRMTFTYEEAVERCKKEENSEIAYMHHRYIPGVWRRYFRGVNQIWVHASETWNQYIQKTVAADGTALALAFFGKHYHFAVHANSLIRIDPNIRLQVLCQYKPPMNAAEINYIGRRYSEIYHNAVPVNYGVLIRSASSYTRSTPNLDVCTNALKPFMVDKVGTFIPDKNAMEALSNHRPHGTTLTRSGAVHSFEKSKMQEAMCTSFDAKLRVEMTPANFPIDDYKGKIKCDNMLSAGITHFHNFDAKFSMMSDSRSLPIWCKLGHPIKLEYPTPEVGWKGFVRANGQMVVHKLFADQAKTHPEAREECHKIGAVLSGFSSMEEALVLKELAEEQDSYPTYGHWVGAERRELCQAKQIRFSPDPNDPCSQRNVFKWMENAADNFEVEFWRPQTDYPNPDNQNWNSFCTAFAIGNPHWAIKNTPGYLDDVLCVYILRGYYCQKYVPYKIVVDF